MGLARMMICSRGDVVKVKFPRHDPKRGPKERYAVVLSFNEYNANNDHGVFVAISSGVPAGRMPGVHIIRDWGNVGLDKPSVVVPWLWTIEWDAVIRKAGEIPPYELRQITERLREVIEI
jgi:mRNA-degrading endonuclease toxin of MazEF toxin-antitoxin module